MPADPAGRAQARVALHRIEQDWYSVAPSLESGDRRDQQRARRLLAESVVAAEPLFRVRPWFLSDQFSHLDAAVAPILWRLTHWGIELPASAQAIDRYSKRVFSLAAFRGSLSAAEQEMRA
jgi:RNA polymerase-associated protein